MFNASDNEKTLDVRYSFYLTNGETLQFDMAFELPSMSLIRRSRKDLPAWTKLEFKMCPHCPLNSGEHPACPLAANLVDVVDTFEHGVATDEAEMIIRTNNRSYGRRGPLAQGISSMIGLLMVTSGCPHLDKLRPMAFTHLPFASKPETMYRSISMYLLAQFFIMKRGGDPDWSLQRYVQVFDDINIVNEHISQRLKTVCQRDANLNALTKLDCFASITAISIESDSMEELENLFHGYLDSSSGPQTSALPGGVRQLHDPDQASGEGPNLSVGLDDSVRNSSGRIGMGRFPDNNHSEDDETTTLSIDEED